MVNCTSTGRAECLAALVCNWWSTAQRLSPLSPVPHLQSSNCNPCPAGTSQPVPGSSNCTSCQPGYYAPTCEKIKIQIY